MSKNDVWRKKEWARIGRKETLVGVWCRTLRSYDKLTNRRLARWHRQKARKQRKWKLLQAERRGA